MGKILIADDEPAVIETLTIILATADYETTACKNGKEVLEKLKEEEIDLILLDIMMPELNGYQVCSILKSNPATQFIPIIMVTTLSQIEDKIRGLKYKADDFISKPFNELELVTRVKSLLRIKKLHDYLEESCQNQKKAEKFKENLYRFIIDDIKEPLLSSANELVRLEEKIKDKLTSEEIELVKKLKTNCQLQIDSIENILDIRYLEKEEFKLHKITFDFSDLVANCLNRLNYLIQNKQIFLEKKFSQPLLWQGDRDLLERAVLSLLKNILNLTDLQGKIGIEVSVNPEQELNFTVINSSKKIYHEIQKEDFFNNKELGLYFSKLVIARHQGKIWTEDELNKNNKFVFTLPG